jgi:hypothetical protein
MNQEGASFRKPSIGSSSARTTLWTQAWCRVVSDARNLDGQTKPSVAGGVPRAAAMIAAHPFQDLRGVPRAASHGGGHAPG